LRERLVGAMEELRTVDCHSHTMLEAAYREAAPFDLFGLMSYFERDIQGVTGQPAHEALTGEDDGERWASLQAVLAKARNVSYWRHQLVTYRALFGLRGQELTDRNWRGLNARIRERTAEPDWYRHVTEDVCRLRTQVRNVPWFEDWEPRYFTAILRMEEALSLHDARTRERLEAHVDAAITSLRSLKAALAELTEDYVARGARGIKLAHAYWRTLHCEPVSETVAGRLLARALRGQRLKADEVKRLQDHLIFFLADLAADLGLVFQIHTGVQGNWGHIPDSNPVGLLELVRSHRSVRFDLFHAGYPYCRELGMMGKHYPNVWLNLCWMYVITMEGSRRALAEWLDLVPGHRLLGFGSDVPYPELVYGHLVMARSCLADVLAEKVARDFLSETAARDLARMMLADNGVGLYRLGE
jgi:predicted TIM-barrel fold metal-dependent hydrolase